jgi:dihydrofolate synthase / folylpolyglutamate synthase
LGALGHPERHFAAVHVGGTNGKGSTATMLAEMLLAAGHRVGLYTSPHLVSFRERITVDRVPIAEDAVTLWASRLEEPALRLGATFFEISTAIAFADFAARGVEIAVVEVGLGGRLDATNVLRPLASGVTRIAVEHVEYLGSDRAGIAREKAGIAKRGTPFVTTEADPEIAGVLLAEARARGALAVRLDPSECLSNVVPGPGGVRFDAVTPVRRYAGLEIGLAGAFQAQNALLAVRLAELAGPAFEVDEAAVRAGLRRARVAGRFERRGPWIFDVAHNPDGARALVAALGSAAPRRPVVAVVAVLRDKAWREMLEVLGGAVEHLVLTCAPSAPPDRAWNLEEVAAWARERGLAASVQPDFDAALDDARRLGETVLVTGSFHTVGDALCRLPGAPPLG